MSEGRQVGWALETRKEGGDEIRFSASLSLSFRSPFARVVRVIGSNQLWQVRSLAPTKVNHSEQRWNVEIFDWLWQISGSGLKSLSVRKVRSIKGSLI